MHLHDSRIFIVDDELGNVQLLTHLLRTHGFTHIASTTDSEVASAELPGGDWDLLVLDLSMPEVNGLELLEYLQPMVKETPPRPVLVITGDRSPESRRKALELGALDFVNKPFDAHEVICRISNLLESRLLKLRLLEQNHELEALVERRTRQLREHQLDSVRRLGLAAEYREDQGGLRIARVTNAVCVLARAYGMNETFVENIGYAAQLRDIGQLAVPDSILHKPGPLDADEWQQLRRHVEFGANLLRGSDCPILMMAEQICLYHHERWDGKGYLEGLRGSEIPLPARLVSLCDAFDAMLSERPYRRALEFSAALDQVHKGRGSQFDPDLADLFLNLLEQGKVAF